jgi:hypothetical protein
MPQSQAPAQLTNVPPKPTCSPAALTIFGGGPDCQDRWNAYNQAVQQRTREELQLYVNRQKDLASSQAAAPLQQQIADLNKLVADQQGQLKKMSEQMQADAIEAKSAEASAVMQARAAAHTQGLEYGAGIGVGASLVLFAIIFGIKRAMSNFTVTKKPQAQGAAVGK